MSPLRSKAQTRFLFAKHPKIAERWAHMTKDIKHLPEHVSKVAQALEAKMNKAKYFCPSCGCDWSGKKCLHCGGNNKLFDKKAISGTELTYLLPTIAGSAIEGVNRSEEGPVPFAHGAVRGGVKGFATGAGLHGGTALANHLMHRGTVAGRFGFGKNYLSHHGAGSVGIRGAARVLGALGAGYAAHQVNKSILPYEHEKLAAPLNTLAPHDHRQSTQLTRGAPNAPNAAAGGSPPQASPLVHPAAPPQSQPQPAAPTSSAQTANLPPSPQSGQPMPQPGAFKPSPVMSAILDPNSPQAQYEKIVSGPLTQQAPMPTSGQNVAQGAQMASSQTLQKTSSRKTLRRKGLPKLVKRSDDQGPIGPGWLESHGGIRGRTPQEKAEQEANQPVQPVAPTPSPRPVVKPSMANNQLPSQRPTFPQYRPPIRPAMPSPKERADARQATVAGKREAANTQAKQRQQETLTRQQNAHHDFYEQGQEANKIAQGYGTSELDRVRNHETQPVSALKDTNIELYNTIPAAMTQQLQQEAPGIAGDQLEWQVNKRLENKSLADVKGYNGVANDPVYKAMASQAQRPQWASAMYQSPEWQQANQSYKNAQDPASKEAALQKIKQIEQLHAQSQSYTPAQLSQNQDFQSRLKGTVGATPLERTQNQQDAQKVSDHVNKLSQGGQSWNEYSNWYKKQFPNGRPGTLPNPPGVQPNTPPSTPPAAAPAPTPVAPPAAPPAAPAPAPAPTPPPPRPTAPAPPTPAAPVPPIQASNKPLPTLGSTPPGVNKPGPSAPKPPPMPLG